MSHPNQGLMQKENLVWLTKKYLCSREQIIRLNDSFKIRGMTHVF